jgi:hypothetical protein
LRNGKPSQSHVGRIGLLERHRGKGLAKLPIVAALHFSSSQDLGRFDNRNVAMRKPNISRDIETWDLFAVSASQCKLME